MLNLVLVPRCRIRNPRPGEVVLRHSIPESNLPVQRKLQALREPRQQFDHMSNILREVFRILWNSAPQWRKLYFHSPGSYVTVSCRMKYGLNLWIRKLSSVVSFVTLNRILSPTTRKSACAV